MRVAFDFNSILVNRFSGFYVFGTGLLQGFEELEEKPQFLLFHSRRFSKQAKLVKEALGNWTQLRVTSIKMRWLENLWRYSNYPNLQRFVGEFDIYHCAHHLMPPTKGKPRLMTIHDLRRYKLPQIYAESKLDLFETAVKRADHFLAMSQSTKNDLCSLFAISENKVDVIPEASGIAPVFYSDWEKSKIKIELGKKIGCKLEDYLIVISSPDSRKNILRTVEAFQMSQRDLPEYFKLVVIGQLPKREQEFAGKLKGNSYRNVVWGGIVDDLRPWLGCAKAMIFASLYEGFGIPILEAFACGTAVIVSNISSMPEVAGNAALYVDPLSTESIAQAIVKISNDEQLKQRLVTAGRERGRQFTWRRTAEEVIKVYSKLAGI